jgi:putative acetyltransferase
MQALIVSVLEEYGLIPDLTATDADVLDIELHYRRDGGEFYAVFEHDQLCGTMGLKNCGERVCELRKMYLLPNVRGVGLGRTLLQWAQSEALRLGFVTMQLETASVLKEAIALYEKYDFIRACGSPHVGRCDRIYRKTLIKE